MDENEIGRRIRAARAFGGFSSRLELATRLQMSKETLQRIEAGQREPKRSELLAIAEACDVPMWFLDHGWAGAGRAGQGRGEPKALTGRDLRHLGGDEVETA